MRTQILASVSLLAAGAYAQACMTTAEAQQVADNFQALIDQPFSIPLAEAALTPDYVDWASGVNTLINSGCAEPLSLTGPTFTNRTDFINGQSGQAPIGFQILNLWNNCDTVMLRWLGTNLGGPTTPAEDTHGLIVLEVVQNTSSTSQPWQIQTSYSEFNSGSWLYDLGVFKPTNCSAPQ